MPSLRPSRIDSPPEHSQALSYEERAWCAYDAASPHREARVMAISEYTARVAGGIALGLPAWRVRVRAAVRSSLQA